MSESESETDCDVLVIGGGAAGLCAAISAAEAGARVILAEKNRRPGVKILISGGTRCNLTNARGLRSLRGVTGPIDPAYDPSQAQGARSIQLAFGAGGTFLGPALRTLTVEDSVALFESEGVATKIEANGKVFPASDRAKDVLDALLRRLQRSGAILRCDAPANAIETRGDIFHVGLPDGPITAKRVILAVGGRSYPGCGTVGDGYAIASKYGHTIVEPRPALVPICVKSDWVHGLKGLTLPDISAAVLTPGGERLLARREAILFAHFGLTGPAILDISRAVTRYDGPDHTVLTLDLLPDARIEAIDQRIQLMSRSGRKTAVNLVPDEIPHRLAQVVLREAGIPEGRTGPDLSRLERKMLVSRCKELRIPVTGTLGFAKAEVTSGGVTLAEVEPTTLESKCRPGLFFAGEVLDIDGLIGGYNFQAAWSTGWLAGQAAARKAPSSS